MEGLVQRTSRVLPLVAWQVSHVVIDEVDTMMTQGFRGDIEKLSAPILTQPTRRDSASFVFVTATFTKAVRRLLDEGNYPKVMSWLNRACGGSGSRSGRG